LHDTCIKFNVKKSKCIAIPAIGNNIGEVKCMTLCNSEMKWNKSVEHLGHTINNQMNDYDDIRLKSIDFVCKANYIMSVFKFCSRKIMISLLNVHCTSFYNSILWNFNDNNINDMNIRFKGSLKRIFNVPRHTRSNIIFSITDTISPEVLIHSRFLKFIFTALKSDNIFVSHLANLCLVTTTTVSGVNRKFIERRYGLCIKKGFNINLFKSKIIGQFKRDIFVDADLLDTIKELIEVRDGISECGLLENDEIKDILVAVITER